MKITKIKIKKYRGFEDVDFDLGTNITAISGQNGTQKTTILGMLSQPFSITDKKSLMINEKPLCGGTFRSDFANKFKFSPIYDKAGEHEWTLFFDSKKPPSYTVESIDRDKSSGSIRFWKKGSRSKGSGFIQHPVIYLSLKRLFPIAEDNSLKENEDISLTKEEFQFYQKWFNSILLLTRDKDKVISTNFLSSSHKQTLGANTNHYDWKTNSAGQDNLSKILLAIITFKRLKEKYPKEYNGGILAIDEIGATFYPGSQIKLIEVLNKFSSKFNIQIIFTTHSLTILKEISRLSNEPFRKEQIKLMFLTKEDGKVDIKKEIDYFFIKNHLNNTITGQPATKKINVYTEDNEGIIFAKSLLGLKYTKYLNFLKIPLGSGNLIQLATSKVPSFIFPNSIIMLDGDVKEGKAELKKAKKIKNILFFPTNNSPEQIVAHFLNNLSDKHPLWREIDATYSHQNCFSSFTNDEIQKDREVSKKWFKLNLKLWGRNASKVLNYWKKENKELVEEFKNKFVELHNKF